MTSRVALGGLAPGATCAAITSVCPGSTGLGVPEAAVMAGGLDAVSGSTTMSSMPTHSSLADASVVRMRSCTIRLVVHRGRQGHVDRRHLRGEVRPGRRIGDVGGRDVGPRARRADAIVERDLLHGVVRRAIDVADVVAHADAGDPGRVDGEPQVRRVGGAGPLEGDDRVGELELGDATSGEPDAGLVGVDVGNAGVVSGEHCPRVGVRRESPTRRRENPRCLERRSTRRRRRSVPVLVQSCANGSACGAASARRRATSAVISSAPRAARRQERKRRDLIA